MRRSAPRTTASATPACRAAAGGGFDPSQFADFSDILGNFFGFGDLFGGGRRPAARAQRGEDVRYDLEIAFEEALFGMSADIQVPRMEACEHCHGSGAEPGSGPTTCPTCHGRGEILYQQGFLSVRRTAPPAAAPARLFAIPARSAAARATGRCSAN
jgi:molecular chaperone DnaJ